jgi:hypothetical protein
VTGMEPAYTGQNEGSLPPLCASFMLTLPFDREDGGDMSLRLSPKYTLLHARSLHWTCRSDGMKICKVEISDCGAGVVPKWAKLGTSFVEYPVSNLVLHSSSFGVWIH